MKITADFIKEETQRLLQIIAPAIKGWATPFRSIEVVDLHLKYGLATPEGAVQISSLFIGTESIEALRETILHELTHLIIGLHHAHKRVFWNSLGSLLRKAEVNTELAKNQKNVLSVSAVASLRYRLIAVCDDGSEILVGMFQKKNKKYTAYNPSPRPFYIKEKAIKYFNYQENAFTP